MLDPFIIAWPQIILAIISIILAIFALVYTVRRFRLDTQRAISVHEFLQVFISRERMVEHLIGMYDRAQPGDVIWGQCVSCRNYSTSVRDKVLKAAANNVKFELIIDKRSPGRKDILGIYRNLQGATVVERRDNEFSLQGLSEKEVVLALPSIGGYVAVCIKHPAIVKIFRSWFAARLGQLL